MAPVDDSNGKPTPREPRPILFVHHRSELGGAPTSLSYLIRDLDRERFEPHVFCPPGPAAELFREAGATVHTGMLATFTHIWASTYHGRRWVLLARELAQLPLHLRQFSRTLKRRPFALVHLNDSPLIAAAWLARRAGIPVVWHLRSALPGGGTDFRSRLVRAAVRRFADVSVAINEDVAGSFAVDSEVVPNSVDLAFFRAGEDRDDHEHDGLTQGKPVVAYFGFLYPSKGFQEFIRAAALLQQRGVDATYFIVGGAVRSETFFSTPLGLLLRVLGLARNYEEDAKQLAAELGLSEHVRSSPSPARSRASTGRATSSSRPRGARARAAGDRGRGGRRAGGRHRHEDRSGDDRARRDGRARRRSAPALADAIDELLADPERRRAWARRRAPRRADLRRRAERAPRRGDLRAAPRGPTPSRSSTFTTVRSSAAPPRASRI